MDIEKIKYNYLELSSEIKERYLSGELDDSNDESGSGGFWDLAMELAEYQLPDEPTDSDLNKRDELATLIYYSLLGTVLTK